MLVGPVLAREFATAPRSTRHYSSRALYVLALFVLVVTTWILGVSSRSLQTVGEVARFGAATFSLLAPIQMALATSFSALFTAAAVAQEKDRRTLDLLLMTRMTGSELVLGRLLASMLNVLTLIVAGIGLLALLRLLGGVSHAQVMRVAGVTLTSALLAGSLGSTIGLWLDKSFQTLAATSLALAGWFLAGEALAGTSALEGLGIRGPEWGTVVSPLRAVAAAAQATTGREPLLEWAPWLGDAVRCFMAFSLLASAALNGLAILRVRVWNPSRELQARGTEERAGDDSLVADQHAAPGRSRHVWDNPILWREMRTWAYGKRVVFVHGVYFALLLACGVAVTRILAVDERTARGEVPSLAQPVLPLVVLGLVLVNALAVTSITSERDLRALDLLLVTDLTPKEIVFGKMGGVFYNCKWIVLLPLALCALIWRSDRMLGEDLLFLVCGQLVLASFAAMLGMHAGMTFANSRTAIAVSLGTVLFLLLGIAVCMRMMIAFQTSFTNQMQAFLAFMFGGGVGLYVALGGRRESRALAAASGVLPFSTFYALTSYLEGNYGAAFLVTALAYGFATAAMLVPAVFEFDVATGRTSARDL